MRLGPGWLLLATIVSAVFVSQAAQARVFNFKNEYLASYLRATGGMSGVGSDAFKKAGGADTLYTDEVSYNFSGEIGFLLRFKDRVTVRLGMEILQTKPLKEIAGKNSGGDNRFLLTSEVLILQPTATVEVNIIPNSESRFFIFAGAGLSDITMDNTFAMTATGTSELGGVTDFSEKATATAISGYGGVGYEMLMADTVTVAFELGYRYLPVPKLEFKGDATTIAQGAVVKGGTVLNTDGSKREFDMSGAFVSVGFRFYIDFSR